MAHDSRTRANRAAASLASRHLAPITVCCAHCLLGHDRGFAPGSCPVRFMVDVVHDVDSTRFQLVTKLTAIRRMTCGVQARQAAATVTHSVSPQSTHGRSFRCRRVPGSECYKAVGSKLETLNLLGVLAAAGDLLVWNLGAWDGKLKNSYPLASLAKRHP
jgi:hypothetical protein